ncbi:aminoacylase-1-like [Zingiber officinale]|uniref:aminoacylase-1-like n=1 Tax=Zingiber officinale TaxID=94328 RepID=UPI001C4B9158|nr:aminoacylase-1-like [Zingiber officinale]
MKKLLTPRRRQSTRRRGVKTERFFFFLPIFNGKGAKNKSGNIYLFGQIDTPDLVGGDPPTMLHLPVTVFTLFLMLLSFHSPTAGAASFSQQEEEQIERFQRYLRIRTAHPNPDYAAAAAFLLAEARSIGLRDVSLEFAAGKPLVLLSWIGSDPSLPSLLLNSHMDSVPAEPSRWLHPPFAAVRDAEGRIFARGAQDDKCIAVQYLEAIRNLKASGFAPLRSIHVSLVPDEEIGGDDGAAKFSASEQFRELNIGFMLDEGQASPKDEFRVFYADRSPLSLIVTAVGAPGHGSRMYDGGAMENLMDCVEAAAKFRASQFDQVKHGSKANSEVISVNPVYMKAGTPSSTGFVMNMQPSEAEVGFDLRLPPTADIDLLKKRIEEEWAPSIKNLTYKLIQKGPIRDNKGRPLATPTDESNPWWSAFKQAILASGGKLARPEILSSTTDARFMRQMGIPTLGFSPMKNTPILLHDHNEFLMDSVFLNGIKVYEQVISALSSLPETSV